MQIINKSTEIWKDIAEYEGLYQVSNLGNIKSLGNNKTKKEKILKQSPNLQGYNKITLWKNKQEQYKLTYILVAEAFIPNPDNLPMVRHKDGNKINDNADNLEWCDIELLKEVNFTLNIEIAKKARIKYGNAYDINKRAKELFLADLKIEHN